MTTDASLLSIQVGLPRTFGTDAAADPLDRPWQSSIFKERVAGPVVVRRTCIEGDAQADLEHHGGIDKAICAYSADHYPFWERALNLESFGPGAFGENFTLAGLSERDVCIGDTWAIGEVICQVSQPRQPCWKLARRWRIKDLADQVITAGYTGWYFRVVTPGVVDAGARCRLVDRPHPEWTIIAANQVMHGRPTDRDQSHALGNVALLSGSWKMKLTGRT